MADPDPTPADHPYDVATAALADVAERAVEYADIWRQAISRHAAGDYRAEDALVDVQSLWGLSVRDATRVGSALLEAMAPFVPRGAFASDGAAAPEPD